jgi:hypothetical protein
MKEAPKPAVYIFESVCILYVFAQHSTAHEPNDEKASLNPCQKYQLYMIIVCVEMMIIVEMNKNVNKWVDK